MATANFINKGNCLVTRDWAIKVRERKEYYLAETPVFYGQNTFKIDSTFYKNVVEDVAAFWGVIKVSYKF